MRLAGTSSPAGRQSRLQNLQRWTDEGRGRHPRRFLAAEVLCCRRWKPPTVFDSLQSATASAIDPGTHGSPRLGIATSKRPSASGGHRSQVGMEDSRAQKRHSGMWLTRRTTKMPTPSVCSPRRGRPAIKVANAPECSACRCRRRRRRRRRRRAALRHRRPRSPMRVENVSRRNVHDLLDASGSVGRCTDRDRRRLEL